MTETDGQRKRSNGEDLSPDRHSDEAQKRRSRPYWIGGLLLAVLLLAYVLSPYLAAARFAAAVQRQDVPAILDRVDQPALRRSLARQVFRAYAELYGRDRLGAFGEQVAAAVGITIADPILAEMTTPEAVADFLRKGWPAKLAAKAAPAGSTIRFGQPDEIWRYISKASFTSPTEFRVMVDVDDDPDRTLGWRFRLKNLTWMLVGIDLSPQITREIIERLPKPKGL